MRERILAEIKRIALADGGRAPGRESFENETGIRPHIWRGKYWARWSDALSEAGFKANELQQKLDLDSVFPKLAAAVKQFGREPTVAEFEILRHNDPTFPAYKSVINQFESKGHLMGSLRDWALNSGSFPEIISVLPPYLETQPVSEARSIREGYVYLIKSGAFFKIGRGDELEKRVKQIRTALPDASTLEHSIRTDDPAGIEGYWHRRFADKRANGEWFKLSPQDVIAFKKRKFQ